MLRHFFRLKAPAPKINGPVILKHIDWRKFRCAAVSVHDADTSELIFTDTLHGVYDWLDDRHYKWLGAPGLWGPIE